MLALRELQERFLRAIAGVPGPAVAEGFEASLLAVVTPRAPLGAAARLDVYAQMYWTRLHDVLLDDFPRLSAAVGPAAFQELACRYLLAHPSGHPSVRQVGRHFAAFVAEDPVTHAIPFAADLARLEWARLEVFDASDAEPLRLDDLRRVPPIDWADLAFALVPAARLVRTAWPVHETWRALSKGAGTASVVSTARPTATHLRVWRSGFMVSQASMDTAEEVALGCVVRRETFAGICAGLATVVDPADAARVAAALVMRWIEDGIVTCA